MRRRVRTAEELVAEGKLPAELVAYREGDGWPGRDLSDRYSAWLSARSDWGDARWPGGAEALPGQEQAWRDFPDGIFRPEEI